MSGLHGFTAKLMHQLRNIRDRTMDDGHAHGEAFTASGAPARTAS